ncbi:MAG: hypothetical protein COB26_01805 [Piscirickettsiaceae bacterium]|nr:MAG: hypothetical protein COB89_02920 [Piscirickettsiaceae bacterium]PCI70828.1 MAG: hypothetical protein COB26_01805 [Piscirickettsiaceae bacterium]
MDKLMSDSMQQLYKWLALMTVLCALLWSLSSWMSNRNTLPIKFVRIEGQLTHVSKDSITSSISNLVESGYFAVNTQQIIAKLETLEWIKKVKVSRVWPDTISLSITEQKARAYWNKVHILNEDGMVIKPELVGMVESLPQLAGEDSKSVEVYLSFKRVNASLKEFEQSVVALSKSAHGSWSAMTKGGVSIAIGSGEPIEKIVSGIRLLSSVNMNVLGRIKQIDMRYPNGVSVVWKEDEGFNKREMVNKDMQLAKS